MTLSAMGEAETPAGGSVCMRYRAEVSAKGSSSQIVMQNVGLERYGRSKRWKAVCFVEMHRKLEYLEISHEAAAGRGRHDGR